MNGFVSTVKPLTHDSKKELEELIGQYAKLQIAAALDVLEDAVERCRHEDIRTPEIFDALHSLESRSFEKSLFDQFREALDHSHCNERHQQTLNANLNAIKLIVLR
jgi:hypothetical protein